MTSCPTSALSSSKTPRPGSSSSSTLQDPLLRARLRACVAERDTSLAAGMRRAGVPIHRIGTEADLATALIEVVASTRRRRA